MKKFTVFCTFLSSFFIVDVINQVFARSLNRFGLVPRQIDYFSGIFFSPWLHGSFHHLTANLAALIVLALVTWQWSSKTFWKTTAFIICISGILVWLIGRPAFHIGASGLVYGYFGFCVVAGWLSKKFYHLVISIVITVLYGSMVWGVLPIQPGMSFEYHLMGALSGIFAAKLFVK